MKHLIDYELELNETLRENITRKGEEYLDDLQEIDHFCRSQTSLLRKKIDRLMEDQLISKEHTADQLSRHLHEEQRQCDEMNREGQSQCREMDLQEKDLRTELTNVSVERNKDERWKRSLIEEDWQIIDSSYREKIRSLNRVLIQVGIGEKRLLPKDKIDH